jgi:hypothetical protein
VPARTRGPLREKHTQEEPHSSIQVKPNTRPSLRDGWTAYAVLSREPSSFWPPSPSRNSPTPRRLTRMPPPQRLGRSNDGQDHTVLPYARPAISPQFSQPCRRSRKLTDETKPGSAAHLVRSLWAHGEQSALPTPLAPERCRVHRKPSSRNVTTQDRPSRSSRDGQHIRQIRISVKWNIFTKAD